MLDKVSVIVPVFQVELFLEKCIKSIIQQSYRNIEVILVDDGSTDNSPMICDEFAQQDDRIRVVHQKNGGVSSARNAGIDLMQGDCCCFIDGDDYLDESYISSMLHTMQEKSVDMVCCGCWRENLNGDILWERKTDITQSFDQKGSILELFTPTSFVGWPWNKLFKTSIIKEYNIRFNENIKYCEDEIFVLTYLLHSKNTCYVKEQLYHYMENNMSANMKIYTEKKFDIRCLDRQKADEISASLVSSLNDKEIENVVKARAFTSNMATLSKMFMAYSDEYYNELLLLRKNLRRCYIPYLLNDRFQKDIKREIINFILCINPLILLWVSRKFNKRLI